MALRDPSTFNKGALLAVAWLVWFLGGATYVATTFGFKTFLANIPADLKVVFAIWLLTSTSLLYFAIVYLIRGCFGRSPPQS